ncbi:uncharacterized protein [Montipora foliosa]|uniref:uncharacterized protein n=1 Tax=Montipora foliosa TaxID=591990 RepID=UPI0035F1359F
MHEVIEGLAQVEVVADDFVVIGHGITLEEGTCDHGQERIAFLQRCQEHDRTKAEQDGLRVDPAKVKAVLEMPAPTDKTGIQRLLGMIQYLSKFLPHLSDKTKPLRDLTQQDVEWCWGDSQDSALKQIKGAVTHTPLLRYYILEDEVPLQCDALQYGLGMALLKKCQPVAYAL